jgi:hypothetical protein
LDDLIHSAVERVKRIRTLAPSNIGESNIQEQSFFAQYYCILLCGLLEVSIRILIGDFAQKHSRPEIRRFITSRLERFSNVRSEGIKDLLVEFSSKWALSFEAFTEGQIGSALDSLKSIRNQVAHGSHNGTSLGTIDNYAVQVFKVVIFLQELIT